ncbi:MAG: response regulator transcription factor [Deltaproteobacteria bacterium]|nr:response regulator transcription factor [Deltaproteobacteria bacterium]
MLKVRVALADDHALVREGFKALLATAPDIEVVGEAANGQDAIKLAAAAFPDVMLMDIAMPGLGGLEATLAIKKDYPQIKIIVLSQYDDKEYVNRFLRAGASGYMLKKAVGDELLAAVRAVARGESYLYPSIAASLLEGYRRDEKLSAVDDPYETLTPREREVFKLIAEGLAHKEIAAMLDISVKTAIVHRTNISEKLGIKSKADLIKYAIQKGVIKLNV